VKRVERFSIVEGVHSGECRLDRKTRYTEMDLLPHRLFHRKENYPDNFDF
jgi:hypothetical protein